MTQDNFKDRSFRKKELIQKEAKKKDMANTLTQTGGLEGWVCVF